MIQTSVAPFDSTFQSTNVWLHDVLNELGWQDRTRAYHALRAVLHAMRDQLPISQIAALAAQLPMLIRGFYYEGWKPHEKPFAKRNREVFLAHGAAAFRDSPDIDPERVARAVAQILAKHLSAGEIDELRRNLPTDLRSLWT